MIKTAAASGQAFDVAFDTNAAFPVDDGGAELLGDARRAWYAARQRRLLQVKIDGLKERVKRQEAFLADAKAALAEAQAQLGKES